MVKQHNRRSEAGFTLVELAIVMIIIGLLIGGILKGQELIANAQITSTVAQIKGIDAAASTFRDAYNALAGDYSTATDHLTNCVAANSCGNGNGDGRLGVTAGDALTATDEGAYFFNHLRAADLVSGFDGKNTVAFGETFPTANVGGGFLVGYAAAGTATGLGGATLRTGHYLVLTGQVANAANTTGIVTPAQAARIDRKMDDGIIDQGSVQANTNCVDGTTPGAYDEGDQSKVCNVYIRIQG